jgi:CHAT domain-containing protein/tetratricopeptide (TPR) repeat protein
MKIPFSMLGFLGAVAALALADDPKQAELAKKPQWQRMLTGEDAKATAKLEKRIEELEATDDYEAAIKSAEQLLSLRTKVQGGDHFEVANEKDRIKVLKRVAGLEAQARREWQVTTGKWREAAQLFSQAKYAEALTIRRQILEIHRKVLGEEHSYTATSYNNVAAYLVAQGKAAEAGPLFQKALVIHRKVLGEEHPVTANSYSNLASNLVSLGKAKEAQPLYQKALDIARQVLGEDHPYTANSYNGVAFNLHALGKAAEAQPLLQKALDIRRKVLGEDHPVTAGSYNNVAYNLAVLGKAAEAQPLYQKALDINRKVLGEDHPDTARSYNNLAANLDTLGKATEAQSLYQNSLAIRRKVLGEEHPDTANSYHNVAFNLHALGKAAEAQPLLQKALDINRKVLGEEHPETANSYNGVASNLHALGKAAEAQPLYQKALDIRRKVLGAEHPVTAHSYSNLAYNLAALGKATEAQPLLQKALDIHRKVMGEEHPDTATIYNNLAGILIVQGKAADAESILRQAIFSAEASRLSRAKGIERAIGEQFNPRLALATMEQRTAPAAAWAHVEATLARGLLDQHGLAHSNLTADESAELARLQDRIADRQSQILKLVSQSKRSESETARLEQLLTDRRDAEEKLAVLAVAASTRAVASREQIQAAIPVDAALLLWIDVTSKGGVEEHFACVVRRDREPKWERLPGRGESGKWTKEDSLVPGEFRDALTSSAPADRVEALAKKLQAQRIAPVLKHLDGVSTLYVVGIGEMVGIPVEALTDRFAVSYVPSGTFLAQLKDWPKPASSRFLAIGDAIYETEKQTVAISTDLPSGGLLITQVVPQSAAANAGLRAGDVLLKYGDSAIATMEDLQKASAANAKVDRIALSVWREGRAKPLSLEIAPGRMGVALDREPAPEAIANRRKTEAMLASIRGGEWKDLPGTRVETNRLQQLFGESAKVLTDGDASEQTLESLRKSGELAKYRYLHFATHGEGNNAKAFESALILSQDKLPKDNLPKPGEPWINGQLSAREVLDYWKLDAELVTLSACETAIGKSGGGDGLLGFAQAFLTAGARSVCLSLWKVDDTATALLMSRFYENLLGRREGLAKPMGKAAALDEAKRWLRNLSREEATARIAKIGTGVARGTRGKGVDLKVATTESKDTKPFAHPKYWAAFILIGDPN